MERLKNLFYTLIVQKKVSQCSSAATFQLSHELC